jgi:hypothetical protein
LVVLGEEFELTEFGCNRKEAVVGLACKMFNSLKQSQRLAQLTLSLQNLHTR